jgi:DNA-binding response OmpR family regulator
MVEKSAILSSRILIVDDNHANVQVLESLLRNNGYLRVDSTMDPTMVCLLHLENRYDLILLDLLMPVMDGFQVMSALGELAQDAASILVVTAQPSHKMKAMQAGAKDFIGKPFDHLEMLTRIHYMLEVQILQRAAEDHSRLLEQTVSLRTAELRRSGEMFRELAANIPQALWIRDLETQTIEYANPA